MHGQHAYHQQHEHQCHEHPGAYVSPTASGIGTM
jgi:hypothetical protein